MIQKVRSVGEQYLRDFIYAANDGLVTTFAVVASLVGAGVQISPLIIVVIAVANLVADAFSMASGNYLGTKSEGEQYDHERDKKAKEIKKDENTTKQDAEQYFIAQGYSKEDARTLTKTMAKNKNFFLDILMYRQMGIAASDMSDALRNGTVTFFSFLFVGAIPLIPYVMFSGDESNRNFIIACTLTGIAMFVVGAMRTVFSAKNWFLGGLEMLMVGSIAIALAYGLGYFVSTLVPAATHLH